MTKLQPNRKLKSVHLAPHEEIPGNSVPSGIWCRSIQYAHSNSQAYILMIAARRALEVWGREHLPLPEDVKADTSTPIFDFPLFTLRHDPHRLISSKEEANAYFMAKTRYKNSLEDDDSTDNLDENQEDVEG